MSGEVTFLPGAAKPSILRVKRRREDIGADGVIVLEAPDRQQRAAGLTAELARMALAQSAGAGGAEEVVDEPPPTRRRVFRLVQGGPGAPGEPSTAPELLERIQASGAAGKRERPQEGATEGSASGSEEGARGFEPAERSAAEVARYEMVPKRTRLLGEGAAPADPLQESFHVYDIEKLYGGAAQPAPSAPDAGYVYDIYCLDEAEGGAGAAMPARPVPVVQVERFADDWLVDDDGRRSSFDSQDSNDEDDYRNDYPDDEDYSASSGGSYDPEGFALRGRGRARGGESDDDSHAGSDPGDWW
eukprot:jgi/Tetstr1/459948/TSEL_000454.t1